MAFRLFLAAPVLGLALTASTVASAGGCPSCFRHVGRPPVYGTVAEQAMVQPPFTIVRTFPMEFATRPETTVIPGGRAWKVKRDRYGRLIGCWVNLPPRYVTRQRAVLLQMPQQYVSQSPAVYGIRERSVVIDPGYSAWVPLGHGGF